MTSNPASASGAMLRHQIRIVSGHPCTSRSGKPPSPARTHAASTPGRTSARSSGKASGSWATTAQANLRSPMAERRYEPNEIEPRWQAVWADERSWEVSNEPDERPKAYVLEMLPYPSGEPHIGHLKTYSVGDAIAHHRRRSGFRVLHPMGYDAFGLPAENHAIKTGEHPRDSTRASIEAFQRQFLAWGISIDWT